MASAETAGDEGFALKNQRLWLAFLICFMMGINFITMIGAGIINAAIPRVFHTLVAFLVFSVFTCLLLAFGYFATFGYYKGLLILYGILSLVLSVIFFIIFCVLYGLVGTESGYNQFIARCEDFCEGHDSFDEEDCPGYFEILRRPALAMGALYLILSFILVWTAYMAFKMKWMATSTGNLTARYEVGATSSPK